MTIVQINSEYKNGSTGKIVFSLKQLLDNENQRNFVFYSGNHHHEESGCYQINSKFSIRVSQILSRLFGNEGLNSKIATYLLIRKLSKIRPDIIHLHNIHGYYLNFKLLFDYTRKEKIQIVWTLHDCWAFTGHCAYFSISGCEKWKDECGDCPSKKEYPYSLLFDKSKALYNLKRNAYFDNNIVLVTPSSWLNSLLSKSILSDKQSIVINNGIDLSVFRFRPSCFRDRYDLNNKHVILGVASNWGVRKGLNFFIELSKIIPDDYRIILVGLDHSKEYLFNNKCIIIGRTNNQIELAEVYSAADVFYNPTLEENYPTVNMEAIACGTPVVTFDTGGCSEIVENERTGLCMHSRSVQDSFDAIVRIVNNRESFHEACLLCREKFNQDSRFKEYLELYDRLSR